MVSNQLTRLQDCISETETTCSQGETGSPLPLRPIQKQETQSLSLLSASVPLGRAALVSSIFSLFFSSSHLYFFFFLLRNFERPTFSMPLWSHTTDEMTHGRKERGILLHGLKLNSHDVVPLPQHNL